MYRPADCTVLPSAVFQAIRKSSSLLVPLAGNHDALGVLSTFSPKVSNHENIVGLLGRCGTDIVTEYYPLSMDKLIFGEVLEDGQVKRPKFNARKVIGMALDAARGLEALHEAPGGPIIHADLQPKQLLLDDKWVVKINDLNRCRFLDRDAAGRPCPVTIKRSNGVWRSPEEYLDGQARSPPIGGTGWVFPWHFFFSRASSFLGVSFPPTDVVPGGDFTAIRRFAGASPTCHPASSRLQLYKNTKLGPPFVLYASKNEPEGSFFHSFMY